jgi:hypothetical protein
MSIADQIEKIGRALTAGELAKLLSVSVKTKTRSPARTRKNVPRFRLKASPMAAATTPYASSALECVPVVSLKKPFLSHYSQKIRRVGDLRAI